MAHLNTRDVPDVPANTTLLLIDMQNFCAVVSGVVTDQCVEGAPCATPAREAARIDTEIP